MRRILFPLYIASWVVQLLFGPLAWSRSQDTADRLPSTPPPVAIAGPMFITTIYPIVKLDHTLVEAMPIIDGDYNFWGKEHVSEQMIKTYFPTPLAYPYQFSKTGRTSLLSRLKEISSVDPTSVELISWPTIPQQLQYEYQPPDLQSLLIEEPYIQFKMKGWDSVTFMKFPTFVAVVFDYIRPPIRSYADYKALAHYWWDKINSLQQFEDLRDVLGISRACYAL
jgi:hypothetical protein